MVVVLCRCGCGYKCLDKLDIVRSVIGFRTMEKYNIIIMILISKIYVNLNQNLNLNSIGSTSGMI